MSMNPGASTRSSASTVRAAAAPERDPIAAMRPPDTPTSARYQAPPLPSTIRAPRTSRSNGSGRLAADAPAIATETRLAAARSAFRPGAMCCPERRLMLSEVYGIAGGPSATLRPMRLLTSSAPAWLQAVLDDFDAFLLDHAACERKASGTAM